MIELDKHDDYYIHQQKKSIIQVEDDDPEWMDRCYVALMDPKGGFGMNMGLGVYPNAGTMDGWVSVLDGTKQRDIRVFRRVHKDRAIMHCGPLEMDIIDPWEVWHYQMKDNDYGVTFDLTATKAGPILPYDPVPQPNPREGKDPLVWIHVGQAPVFNGTVTFDGKTFEVKNWSGFRDRSWGTRRLWLYGAYWLMYLPFPDYYLYLSYIEYDDNSVLMCEGIVQYKKDGRIVSIVDAKHRAEYEPGTWRHKSTEWELTLEDGQKIHLKQKKVYQSVLCYGAGYCWRQGVDVGESFIESDSYTDINDPAYKEIPTDTYDQLCEWDNGKDKFTGGWFQFGTLSANYKYKPTL